MKATEINATDLRIRTRDIMERVKYRGEIFLVKTFGQPTAVIISVHEYERTLKNACAEDKDLVTAEIQPPTPESGGGS